MPNGSKQGLEERRQNALRVWVDNPLATFEEIGKKAGISDKTFWRYRQDPEFMAEYKKMCQSRFAALEGKAVAKLEKQVDEDNFQAIKYVLDATGYKPTDKIDASIDSVITIKVGFKEDEEE